MSVSFVTLKPLYLVSSVSRSNTVRPRQRSDRHGSRYDYDRDDEKYSRDRDRDRGRDRSRSRSRDRTEVWRLLLACIAICSYLRCARVPSVHTTCSPHDYLSFTSFGSYLKTCGQQLPLRKGGSGRDRGRRHKSGLLQYVVKKPKKGTSFRPYTHAHSFIYIQESVCHFYPSTLRHAVVLHIR